MTNEIIPTNFPEPQAKSWVGSIIKTCLIFSCGVIAGAVIESIQNDQQTLDLDDDDDEDDDREPEASTVDHENEDIEGKDDIITEPESTMLGNFMRPIFHQDSTSTTPKEDELS